MTRRRKRGGEKRLAAIALGIAVLGTLLGAAGFSCVTSETAGPDLSIPRDLAGAPEVRVALERGAARAVVEVRGPYEIYTSEGATRPTFAGEALPPVEVALEPGGAPDRGLRFGSHVFRPAYARLAPKTAGTLVVNGTAYRGDLAVRATADGAGLLVVNRVNLEEYVAGVVGSEMPLAFPEAALRAQAIASRTYGLFQVRGRTREPYDVMDDQSSQVYKGLANETDLARRVTLDTLGVILTYRGRVLCTYFHSTCGGETTSAAYIFGGVEIPPLAGAPCGNCNDSKYFRWRCEVRKADLARKLAAEGFAVGSVGRVEVGERGPAGYAKSVVVTHPKGQLRVAATKLRWLVGTSTIRSTAFEIEDGGGEVFVVAGRGWGHGVGLCQVGARGMARAGHDAMAILRRYYPAAELVRIYGARAAPEGGGGSGGGGG